jgi:hypothetical protein
VNGATVPATARAATASTGPALDGTVGPPSVISVTASAPSAAPRNCTAVTATGSRPGSSRAWYTVNAAASSTEARTSPSPRSVAPAPAPSAVTSPTPASDSAKPAQATGLATVCCHTAAMTATSTGAAPISSAAWVTLVRAMPVFCTMTVPPYPTAPDTSTRGEIPLANPATPWPARRCATGRRTAAARPNRVAVSQPAGNHSRASLDSGTVAPQSSPAPVRAAMA